MDSARRMPILNNVDTAILGGTTAAVETALRYAGEGGKTLLVLQESFLGTDRCMALDYPEGVTPDAYKLELERRCTEAGVELLYGAWVLDILSAEDGQRLIRIGGKFGVAGIVARDVLEYRVCWTDETYRAWLTDRKNPAESRILEVSNPCPAGEPLAARLLRARLAILDADREEGFSLGRFAIRGGKNLPLGKERADAAHAVTARICPLRGSQYPLAKAEPVFTGGESAWDLVVVGGGTSGAMAALTAAQKGLRVAVVEPNYALGGTGTVGGVSAYWFGTRYGDSGEVDRLVARFTDSADRDRLPGIWGQADSWNPDVKATVLLQLLLEAGAEVFFGYSAFGVWQENGKIAGIAACADTGIHFFRAPFLFDATGDGDVAVFAGADSEYGNSVDCVSYWASLAQYRTAGTYQNNFSAMMRTDDPVDYTRFVLNARKFGENLFDHGSYGCCRESRHIRGQTRITLRDLMTHTHHPDSLYTCYSNYDPKGKTTADIVYCGVLPQQTMIEIPLSALIPVDREGNTIEGIYVLGKAISASHDIFPSIRMQKDLMHQGAVMGNLVAECSKRGLRPERLPPRELERMLRSYSDDPLRADLTGEIPLEDCVRVLDHHARSHWVDADFTDCETRFQPLVALMYGPAETVVPLVEEKLGGITDPEERTALIRIQLWHGCDRHVEEFLDRMARELSGPALPKRRGATTCAQLLPDHGVMPEIVYDMNVLAYSHNERCGEPFRQVYDLLLAAPRDYRDLAQGIFTYIESFAFAAERSGNPRILDLAEKLTELPELVSADRMADSDLMKQRLQLLRYLLYRALAANGRPRGYRGLAAQLRHPSLTLALSARTMLERITGKTLGPDPEPWLEWIRQHEDRLPHRRITEKTF